MHRALHVADADSERVQREPAGRVAERLDDAHDLPNEGDVGNPRVAPPLGPHSRTHSVFFHRCAAVYRPASGGLKVLAALRNQSSCAARSAGLRPDRDRPAPSGAICPRDSSA